MANKNIHVTFRQDLGMWQAKTEGAQRAAALTRTKQEAQAQGRQIAQNRQSELVIHNKNGRISDKDSFGNDPVPPRDRVH